MKEQQAPSFEKYSPKQEDGVYTGLINSEDLFRFLRELYYCLSSDLFNIFAVSDENACSSLLVGIHMFSWLNMHFLQKLHCLRPRRSTTANYGSTYRS